jgi:hypothetical protein
MLNRADLPFANALKDVTRQWTDTAPYWRDQARAAFEKEFINELFLSARGALRAMSEVQRALGQIIRECS